MMTNRIGGLTANNAAYNWMSSSSALMNLSFNGGMSSQSLLSSENNYRLSMLNDGLNYKVGLLMDETNKKLEDENIKRTFSVFA